MNNSETNNPWIKSGILAILALILAGALGGITLAALYLVAKYRFVRDPNEKHGISVSKPSRLGGLVIFVTLVVYLISSTQVDPSFAAYLLKGESELIAGYAFLSVLIGVIGLADDLNEGLSPGFRMLLLFGVTLFGFSLNTEWLPVRLFEEGLGLYNLPTTVMVLATSFVLIGFVNAGNMVDGANGLLGIISLVWFVLVYHLLGSPYVLGLILILTIFVLFNIVNSSIILGDFGAFGLSALIALSSFHLHQEIDVSVWFFASVLAYPCFEIVRTITTRVIRGQSPLLADNAHLHNHLYTALVNKDIDAIVANSGTGFLLALSSVLPASILFMSGAPIDETALWMAVFICQVLFFGSFARFLNPEG